MGSASYKKSRIVSPDEEDFFPLNLQIHPRVRFLYYHGSSSRLGDWAEIITVVKATEKGFDVFRNVSSVGKADLVIKNDKHTINIDVKIGERVRDRSLWYWKQQSDKIADGCYGVAVMPLATGIEIRWFRSRKGKLICPPGYESIWD